MSTVANERVGSIEMGIEEFDSLDPGDELDQPTFHRIYTSLPESFRAELIEGVVVIPFATSYRHAFGHNLLGIILGLYAVRTPGTASLTEPTVILGPKSEPQPDATLIILPEHGGRTHLEGDFVAGPPELVAEMAISSKAYDLHSKRRDYEAGGVQEYLVLVQRPAEFHWFALHDGRFESRGPDPDGVHRSTAFPGLWVDCEALLQHNAARLIATLQRGLDTPEHAAFVAELAARGPKDLTAG